jgi:hypothetical protein
MKKQKQSNKQIGLYAIVRETDTGCCKTIMSGLTLSEANSKRKFGELVVISQHIPFQSGD